MALNAATIALAEEIKSDIEIDKKTGTPQVKEGTYQRIAEARGIDAETLTKVDDLNTDFVAASGLAVGELGLNAFKGNNSLDRIDVTLNMSGKNKVDHSLRREVSYANPSEPGTNLVKHGVLRSTLTVVAGNNSGQLGAAYKHLKDLAATELAKA